MKSRSLIFVAFVLLFCVRVFASAPETGFFLPDSVNEMTLKYRTVRGLIVLPVTINDSVQVNLILDTGCRNLILFGKELRRYFKINPGKPVEFSGLGSGAPVTGLLSLDNKVSIEHVLGNGIPIVIVDNKKLFANYYNVQGVIGYEIFLKFEIELNPKAQLITFRPALKNIPRYGYTQVPLHIVDARPVMESRVDVDKGNSLVLELMIDTGSNLGLLLKTTSLAAFNYPNRERVLGLGLNGPIAGYQMISQKLRMNNLEIEKVRTAIVLSPWHNNASIGMDVLKDYIVVLNYCKAYVCFRRNV